MKRFNLILAKDIEEGIGKNNTLPWNLKLVYWEGLYTILILMTCISLETIMISVCNPTSLYYQTFRKEFGHYKSCTARILDGKKPAIVMGRRTWDSIPTKFKPPKNKHSFVISATIRSVEN